MLKCVENWVFAILFSNVSLSAFAVEADLNKDIERILAGHNIPGAAVALIEDGQVTFRATFGVRQRGGYGNIDGETIFKIGSLSKAFTSTAIAILVKQGRLKWMDKVIRFIPEFKVSSASASGEIEVRNLLNHTTGIDPLSSEIFLWPDDNEYTVADILKALSQFHLAPPGQANFEYNNLPYVIAGETVTRITGISFTDFLKAQVFQPLGLTRCYAGDYRANQIPNVAQPHVLLSGEWVAVRVDGGRFRTGLATAAGGIRCSLNDMVRWARFHLGLDSARIIPSEILWEMHAAQIEVKSTRGDARLTPQYYGYGWQISDFNDEPRIDHLGGVAGMYSALGIFPKRSAAYVVLLNAESAEARAEIVAKMEQRIMSGHRSPAYNRPSDNSASFKEGDTHSVLKEPTAERLINPGIYNSAIFGEFKLCPSGREGLTAALSKSPGLRGKVSAMKNNKYIVEWDDPAVHSDAELVSSVDNLDLELKPLAGADFTFKYLKFSLTGPCRGQ